MIGNYECTGQMSIFDLTGQPVRITKPIRLIELFAGYGSQAMALKRVGARFEHYRMVEFDKYAVASYNAVHGTQFPPLDITQIHALDLGICDTDAFTYLLTYSFPCTDLSVAGKQAGMSKGSGTRSGLLWEVERILCEIRDGGGELPQILFMENVPQVHGKKNMADFQKWIQFLESLGYTNFWKDLNAKDYGVAQNRNRCFMFSFLGNYTYRFPETFPLTKKLKDYLEDDVEEKYYINNAKAEKLIKQLIDSGTLKSTISQTDVALTGPSMNHGKETLQTALNPDMTQESASQAETLLLKNKGSEIERKTDIGCTLMARDYKGFGNQPMNGVVEWK